MLLLTKKLVQFNKQIKRYQEKQTEFINIISHELKTLSMLLLDVLFGNRISINTKSLTALDIKKFGTLFI
ncbi:MAG: hypothetical protein ACTHKJ_00015, partial [Candidatus Nitrosocosmicus sp.]